MYDSFHLLAYGSNFDSAGTETQLPAIAEQQYNRSSNSFQMPETAYLLAAYASSVGMTRARLNTGSMLPRGLPQILPIGNTLSVDNDANIMDFRDNPIELRKEEDLRVDAVEATAGAEHAYAALIIATKMPYNYNIPKRDCRWVRATATVTIAAFAWSAPVSLTLQDTLEGGNYDIYGMLVQGATFDFARLLLQGQFNRPGCLGVSSLGHRNPEMFRGGLGKWGSFNTYSLPQIEALGDTAGATALEVRLLIAKGN